MVRIAYWYAVVTRTSTMIENVTFIELPTTAYWYARGSNMKSRTMAYWYALHTGMQSVEHVARFILS